MRLPFSGRRPSPAMGVAFLALVLAVSGTAVALPGKNRVTSDDLKRGSVKNSDIGRGAVSPSKLRNGAVTNPKLGNEAVSTAKIRNDAVTGEKVNEGTLGQVPSAASATNANTVGGLAPSGVVRSAFAGDDSLALSGVTSGTALTTTIEAPGAGFLLINAGTDAFGSAADSFNCFIEVDEVQSAPSIRTSEIEPAANSEDNCTTETTVQGAAGSHKVDFEGTGLLVTTNFDETSLQVLYVPFGANGAQP